MTKQEAEAAMKKYGSKTKASQMLRVSHHTLSKALNGAGSPDKPTAKTAGRSLTEFRATYDKDTIVPQRIREGIRALAGGWEYESAFAKLAGVSLSDLGNYREQFEQHIVTIRRDGKRAWASTPKMAAAMKEML